MELKIMALLRVLVDNAGEVMTRQDLISAVWGVQYGGDESLSRGVSILRKALGDKKGHHKYIITIPRVGYRFMGNVDRDYVPEGLEPIKPDPFMPTKNDNPSGIDRNSDAEVGKAFQPLTYSDVVSKVNALPARRITKIAGFIAVSLTAIFLIFLGGRASETLSLQAKMEQGFSHIENFATKGAIQDAQDIFSDVLSEEPSHAAARAGLAFSIFREYTHLEFDPALLQRAKAHAEAALRADEHLALANVAVAWAAELEGDLERSHEYLDRADILDQNNIFSFEGRYRTFGLEEKFDRAEDVLNAAIAVYPEHALFYAYRANDFARMENFSAAEVNFRKAIELSPDNARTYAELAHSLYSQGRTDEAVSVIQQGLKINETALLYNNLGTYLFFQGQYGLAASAFEKTLELDGDTHNYLYWANLADAYRWSEDKKEDAEISYKRALQLLKVGLDLYPNNINLKSRAAMFNAKLGDLDKAQFYMDSFDLNADSPSIQLYRAVITYEIMSNRPKALESLEAALKANYPLIEILNDPELARLRQDPAYHKLLAQTKND